MKTNSQKSNTKLWLGVFSFALLLLAICPQSEAQSNTFPSSGNVGIGTTSPDLNLVIGSSGHTQEAINAASGSFDGNLVFRRGGANKWVIQSRNSAAPLDSFVLYDAVNGAFRLTVDRTGNVGIGTTSPDTRLSVVSVHPSVTMLAMSQPLLPPRTAPSMLQSSRAE